MQKKWKISVIIIILGVLLLPTCRKEVSCEGCNEKNQPPVAAAGNDQVITLPTDSVLLDGSTSSDPDGSISKWQWKKISGPPSFNITNAISAITVVKALLAGTYMFELNVTDQGGLTDRDTIIVIVDSVLISNHPPVAHAGNDTIITLPSNTINLDGSRSSDPENNITTYAWNKISGPTTFTIANAGNAQTQIASLIQGAYQFELKVTDAGGLVSKDTIRITVFPVTAREIIFTNQVLINLCYQPDVPGACWINSDSPSYGIIVSDTANVLPDSSIGVLGVWVKMDTSSVWEQVPVNCWQYPSTYPQSNFTYCLAPDILSLWSWFFSFENLTGRKADVKISF